MIYRKYKVYMIIIIGRGTTCRRTSSGCLFVTVSYLIPCSCIVQPAVEQETVSQSCESLSAKVQCRFNGCLDAFRSLTWFGSPSFCSKMTPRKIKCHLNTHPQYNCQSIIGISSSSRPHHPPPPPSTPPSSRYLHTGAIF